MKRFFIAALLLVSTFYGSQCPADIYSEDVPLPAQENTGTKAKKPAPAADKLFERELRGSGATRAPEPVLWNPSEPPAPGPKFALPPNDPCLAALYCDWQEMSANETTAKKRYLAYRVVIERPRFELRIEAIRKDHSLDVLYRTHVGLGDAHSPTPEGRFVLNHLYPYPDVLYFDVNSNPVQGLYKGFFAPLSLCDGKGKCRRYRDMGIHGYEPKARDGRSARFTDTYGAISAGCVRVPDPCKFKTELIKLVGVGPLKSDDRGSYHWLRRPVEVIITDVDPDVEESLTLVSVFQQSIEQVQNGIKDIFSLFGN